MSELLKFLSGNPWTALVAIVVVLLGALGIQNKRVKSAKQKADDEKQKAQQSEDEKKQQQEVVKQTEQATAEFVGEKDEVVGEIVPEIEKVKDIPQEEQHELSDKVKEAAKAQVERINKRRAKK